MIMFQVCFPIKKSICRFTFLFFICLYFSKFFNYHLLNKKTVLNLGIRVFLAFYHTNFLKTEVLMKYK